MTAERRDCVGLGIVGCGTWGVKHARVYRSCPNARLVAVCDLDADRARAAAETYGAARWTTDYEELMVDPEVEAVSVVVPDFAHRGPVVAAANAGKHILLEKPLATTLEDARAMVEAVEQAGVKLMVDFHCRWSPPFYAARQALRSGQLGEPVAARLKIHDTIYVPTKMLSWAARSSPIWFLGSHGADLLRWLVDDEVRTVYCVARSGVLNRLGVATPDVFMTTLTFRNGFVATMETGWILPESEPAIVDFRFDMTCGAGAVRVNFNHNRMLEVTTRDRVECPNMIADVEVFGKEYGLTLESIRHFVACVAEDRAPLVTARDGLINTATLVAALESAQHGRPVDVPAV